MPVCSFIISNALLWAITHIHLKWSMLYWRCILIGNGRHMQLLWIGKDRYCFLLQNQLVRDGSVQSAQTQITLTGLQTCSSYWVTVAVVNSCGVRRSGQSDPKLIGLYDTRTFELLVTLTTKTCTTWITENANSKISDLTMRLQLTASTCGITIPCIVSSQWQCQNDDAYIARFS